MFRLQPTRSLARSARIQFVQPRFLSTSRPLFARKSAEDKDSINTSSNEYSKSGSDDAAAHTDAAFNPNQTSPEAAEASAEKESGDANNSLNVSPGNHEVSHANDPEIGGASQGTNDKPSGSGSPNKQGGGSSGGGSHN
ncbi:uncharacterized protein M421DRAFT_7494 [Didymella exigua CBS 183.55]|uniref:Uncharacterized protein n=1 Tax=Didymella exigua CBS 183.55 TaxID=1150837 RepID=A0A6A5RER2_9PLEO|nr:uncharacterized protein M421DRAFT_7494 [Didymella exigua CBS 183.55]KAF1925993.1 hypothetical protein M421DRAFT_7494 [Didymella exigua CBS 183.55]